MFCLLLSRVHFWLATIDSGRIEDDEIRAAVVRYQEECADVLFAHFSAKAAASATPAPGDALAGMDILAALSLVRETRLAFGRPAARAMWRRLPALPQVEGADWSGGGFNANAVNDNIASVRDFLAECTEEAPGCHVQARDLHRAYRTWCAGNEVDPLTQNAFGRVCRTLGLRTHKCGTVLYRNRRLNRERKAA